MSEEQISALELVLRTPQSCAPTAWLHSQLSLALHQHIPGNTLTVESPPCAGPSRLPQGAWLGTRPAFPGPLCVPGLQATQAELSSDSSNLWLVVFIDPIHVLGEEGIYNLLQMLVRTKPASDSKGPPSRVMDGDLFLSCL